MRPLLPSLFTAVLALAVAGCPPGGARAQSDAQPGGERAPLKPKRESRQRVEVAALSPSAAVLEFTFPGEVEGSRDALLAAPQGGYVESVLVRQGDRVKKGQALVRVDTSLYAARRDQAKADFDQATNDAQRTRTLGEAVARAQREAAETRLKVAEAGLKLAEAQVSRSVVSAPFDGTVAQMQLEVGEVKAPGAPLVRLVQVDPVKVTLSVADRDVGALRPGLPVRITTDALRSVLEGKVTFVSPASDVRTRAFRVEVEAPNPEGRLLPGMIARVRIAARDAGGGLVIPQEVVVTRMNEVGVYVDEGGRAKWQPLELGAVVGEQVVVSSGISEGDRLVVTGHRALVEGDRLDVAREGRCCTRGRVAWPGAGAPAP
jgi:membrane fusion protein (multidrug efflux system)